MTKIPDATNAAQAQAQAQAQQRLDAIIAQRTNDAVAVHIGEETLARIRAEAGAQVATEYLNDLARTLEAEQAAHKATSQALSELEAKAAVARGKRPSKVRPPR